MELNVSFQQWRPLTIKWQRQNKIPRALMFCDFAVKICDFMKLLLSSSKLYYFMLKDLANMANRLWIVPLLCTLYMGPMVYIIQTPHEWKLNLLGKKHQRPFCQKDFDKYPLMQKLCMYLFTFCPVFRRSLWCPEVQAASSEILLKGVKRVYFTE